jgi:hypothetical protein
MTTEVEIAYAAGLFDGEGSITLTRNRSTRFPSPQVAVASNDREVLEWLKARFGGSISAKQPRRPTHSVSYDWRLTDRRALEFLRQIRPHLQIQRKVKRIDLLLNEYVLCTPRNGRYTDEMEKAKQALVTKFFDLS